MLRVFQLKPLDQLLGARPARAFGQNGDLGMKIVPRLEVRLRLPFLIDSLIVGADTTYPVAIEQQLAPGKPGKQRDPRRLDLSRHPLNELVNGDDIVAMV